MKTLLLDIDTWDLVVDASGNLAVADRPYALAQDVASAIRLFLRELWYDTTKGVPYFQSILGQAPPIVVFQEAMVAAALSVPNVVSATCVIESFENRTVKGQVTFVDDTGATGVVAI